MTNHLANLPEELRRSAADAGEGDPFDGPGGAAALAALLAALEEHSKYMALADLDNASSLLMGC